MLNSSVFYAAMSAFELNNDEAVVQWIKENVKRF